MLQKICIHVIREYGLSLKILTIKISYFIMHNYAKLIKNYT